MLGMFMADVVQEEPVGDVTDASTFDTAQLGFMCGLEVHQQLATGKLHSRETGELYDITIDTLEPDLLDLQVLSPGTDSNVDTNWRTLHWPKFTVKRPTNCFICSRGCKEWLSLIHI